MAGSRTPRVVPEHRLGSRGGVPVGRAADGREDAQTACRRADRDAGPKLGGYGTEPLQERRNLITLDVRCITARLKASLAIHGGLSPNGPRGVYESE